MSQLDITQLVQVWTPLAHSLAPPRTDGEYQRLVAWLDNLIDEVGEDETHPLASLMEVIGVLIESYEDEHVPELKP